MIYTLKNDVFSYSLNEKAQVVSVRSFYTGREYCTAPGDLFRLIYKTDDFEERPVTPEEQMPPEISVSENVMHVIYPTLNTMDGVQNIRLEFTLTLEKETLRVVSFVQNDSDLEVMEIQTTALAGIGDTEETSGDALLTPVSIGERLPDPYHYDFFKKSYLFKKKYEQPDHIRSVLDIPYPGYSCMQWFALYNEKECLYIGNEDTQHRMICMHTERRLTDNTLRLGICQYPTLKRGESYKTPAIAYAILKGDWHAGSKYYRKWMDEVYGWNVPKRPLWAEEFEGWLRCIFRTQTGEFNFRFTDIPRMYDELAAVGLNTLFVLGWPIGGFGRRRGDYYLDPRYVDDFKKGVDYVHAKGGRIFMYISYFAVDDHSQFYREEGGEAALVKDVWGRSIKFAETYAGAGTYRKLMNNPREQYCTCSGSDLWHEKMKKSAEYCLSVGADGVLFDLGGFRPFLCCAEGHDHKKPNESRVSKSARYKDLHDFIHEKGGIILMEHVVDIYSQHMDFCQGSNFGPRHETWLPEMYRYTFPEVKMTDRNFSLDETDYLDHCNYSFMMNLAYDLSIFRCAGLPSDIPNYTGYMAKLIALKKQHAKFFHFGKFSDQDGFTTDGSAFNQRSYIAKDGSLGIAVWNWSAGTATQTYTNSTTGKKATVTLEKDTVAFIEL